MLDALRQLYMELGLETKAAELARETVALAKAASGQDSEAHLAQLVNLANALEHADAAAEHRRVIEQGLGIAERLPSAPNAVRADLYSAAAAHYRSTEMDKANVAARKAVAEARALAQPALLAQTLETAGVTATQGGDQAAAEALLSEAVVTRQGAGNTTFDMTRSLVQLAEVQARRLRFDAALTSLRAALAETQRINGPAHIDTSQTRLRLGGVWLNMGHLRAALAEFEPLHAELAAAATPDIFTLPLVASGLGQALLRVGRAAESEAMLRSGIEMRDRTRGGTRVAAELREDLVHTLLALGRVAEAETLRAEASRIREAIGIQPGQRIWAPQALVAVAVARAKGDAHVGRQALADLALGADTDTADSLGWLNGSLVRARFGVDLGQLGMATTRLRRMNDVMQQFKLIGRLPLIEGQRLTLCARIAAAGGAGPQAAALFEQARVAYASELSEAAPLMREWAQARAAALSASARPRHQRRAVAAPDKEEWRTNPSNCVFLVRKANAPSAHHETTHPPRFTMSSLIHTARPGQTLRVRATHLCVAAFAVLAAQNADAGCANALGAGASIAIVGIGSFGTEGCEQITLQGLVPSAVLGNGPPVHFQQSVAAQASPGVVHARAQSHLADGTGIPIGGTTATAHARSVTQFSVAAASGLERLPVQISFHVAADGFYGSTSGRGSGLAKFAVEASASERADQFIQHYRDSNGVERNERGGASFEPVVNAFVDIDFVATFVTGIIEGFAFGLSVSADGNSVSDFSNTGKLTDITVLSDGFELSVLGANYARDPNNPRHYVLVSEPAASVPEPQTPALLALGLVALALRGKAKRR